MSDNQTERREIAEGTIIKLNGIPLRVCTPFTAETHPNNWALALAPLPEFSTGNAEASRTTD